MVSLKHLPRYTELSKLFVKYGFADFVKYLGIPISTDSKFFQMPSGKEFAEDLKKLGPTFIKLGQFLSTQGNFLPLEYQEALDSLQDKVDSFPYEEVEKIVLNQLEVKIKDAFLEFSHDPIAAGSLSQVHLAKLESGKPVAVKVQRPNIEERIKEDLQILKELAQFLDRHKFSDKHYYWESRIDSFSDILLNELDFQQEAHNLILFSENLKNFESIVVPLPVEDYTNTRILTMDYISSRKITILHPVVKMELDGETLVRELLQAYLKQIFVDGLVHIDPHPGNVYLTEDNKIALLDVGMVEHLSPQFQQDFLKLVIAIADGNGDEAAELVMKMGESKNDFSYARFDEEVADLVAKNQTLAWNEMSFGEVFLSISQISGKYDLQLPQKFNTLGKMLLNLERIGRTLAPSINPNLIIQENIEALLSERVKSYFSKATLTNLALNALESAHKLPMKLANFLEKFGKKELRFKVDSIDENKLLKGFEKIANRITLGLIIASMIIGAALLMRVDTDFQIFGYPGLAILLFLGALLGGILFILNILFFDKKDKKDEE